MPRAARFPLEQVRIVARISAMKSQVIRALFLLAVLFLLNACASTGDTTAAPSGAPVAGEHKSDDSGFGAGVGPSGASGKVSF